jgi:hypothetical protein
MCLWIMDEPRNNYKLSQFATQITMNISLVGQDSESPRATHAEMQ